MALIKCLECGKEISENAEKCPNCGAPVIKIEEQPVTIPHKTPYGALRMIVNILCMIYSGAIALMCVFITGGNTVAFAAASYLTFTSIVVFVASLMGIINRNTHSPQKMLTVGIIYLIGAGIDCLSSIVIEGSISIIGIFLIFAGGLHIIASKKIKQM